MLKTYFNQSPNYSTKKKMGKNFYWKLSLFQYKIFLKKNEQNITLKGDLFHATSAWVFEWAN